MQPRCLISPTRPSPVSPAITGCEYSRRLCRYLACSAPAGRRRRAVCLRRRRLAGYGTGALMPLVLVPLIGAEPVVPIIAISSIFTNLSRFVAYLRYADRRRALIVIAAAAADHRARCLRLHAADQRRGGAGDRQHADRRACRCAGCSGAAMSGSAIRGLAAGAVGYGVVVGGTSGSGVILLSLLMAAGLEGAAVIATDAVISVATSIVKISVFGLAGVVTAQVLAFAVLIGAIAMPGRVPCQGLCRAHAGAHPHRDPRCRRDRRRHGDDLSRRSAVTAEPADLSLVRPAAAR